MREQTIHPTIYAGLRKQKIDVDLIEKLVSERFGIGVYSIRNLRNRDNLLIEAKYVCYYFLYNHLHQTKTKIGKTYKRNHASIISALRRLEDWKDTDSAFNAKIQEVEKKLKFYQGLTIREN